MSNVTYFLQGCPTCGRRLRIRVEFLGKRVACQHCRGTLVAWDPTREGEGDPGDSMLERAEELLKSSARGVRYARHVPR